MGRIGEGEIIFNALRGGKTEKLDVIKGNLFLPFQYFYPNLNLFSPVLQRIKPFIKVAAVKQLKIKLVILTGLSPNIRVSSRKLLVRIYFTLHEKKKQ